MPPAADQLLGVDLGVGRGAYLAHPVLQTFSGMALLWVVALRQPSSTRFIVLGVVGIGLLTGLADALLGVSTGGFLNTLHVLTPEFIGAFLPIALLRLWGAYRASAPTQAA